MRGEKMDELHLSRLIADDIKIIYQEARFTILQKTIFDLMLEGVTIDDDNIEMLAVSRQRYYDAKREVYEKLKRIEPKLGINLS